MHSMKDVAQWAGEEEMIVRLYGPHGDPSRHNPRWRLTWIEPSHCTVASIGGDMMRKKLRRESAQPVDPGKKLAMIYEYDVFGIIADTDWHGRFKEGDRVIGKNPKHEIVGVVVLVMPHELGGSDHVLVDNDDGRRRSAASYELRPESGA